MTKPGKFKSPCRFNWDGLELSADDVKDGQILILTFTVPEDAEDGTSYTVSVTGEEGAVLDADLNEVSVSYASGEISVTNFTPGDVNDDKRIDSKDVIQVRRYIVGGYDQNIIVPAADVNDDLKVNSADVILLRRYIVGGYDVELKRSHLQITTPTPDPDPDPTPGPNPQPEHTHSLAAVAAKSPTCTEAGNIAYWRCTSCNKYFRDAAGQTSIELAATVSAAVGHDPAVDPAVAPTRSTTGLTEGSHCSICGTVLKEQQVLPVLDVDEYFITYDVANGDPYLAGLDIANPNKTSYFEGDSFKLSNLSVDGYRFLGWYDGAGDDSTKVTRITSDYAEDLELYAHWQVVTYTVQYESDLFLDTNSSTYTVDRGLVLPTPKLSNYVFAGWADDTGNLYSGNKISVGTTGNLTLAANWTSERNKTYTNPHPSDPIIIEDEDDHTILFAYEIGRIENVPRYTIKDFGYISGDGVTRSATETYSAKTEKSTMEQLANTVANATTNSSSWMLSSDWNDSTTISDEYLTEQQRTREEIETIARSDSSNWNISNSRSGSSSNTSASSSTDGWSNDVKVNGSASSSSTQSAKISAELTSTVSKEKSFGWNVGGNIGYKAGQTGGVEGGVTGGVNGGSKTTRTISGTVGAEQANSATNSVSRGFEAGASNNHTGTISNSSTNTSGWNSTASYGGSSTTSKSNTARNALTERISQKTGKSWTASYGGSESQGFAETDTTSQTDSYTAATTYDESASESVTSSWTTAATKPGYHRWIVAGTAHVFGVVGYDIETKSFFVSTYTMMDDESHEFEDYSYTTSGYNDNENGVIGFEVPYEEVMSIVSERVNASDGLKVDLETGTIVDYSGTDTCVVIPEYYNAGNGDVVKITGLSSNAFRNKDIVTVVLSDYITEIPDRAFEGCSSLEFVVGIGVTSIGNSAFARCTSLEDCGVYSKVTHLGTNAFEGAEDVYVNAANAYVAQAAIASGAKGVALNLGFLAKDDTDVLNGTVLDVPASVVYFELNGDSRTFNGLQIDSKAAETVLNKLTITGDVSFPVKLASGKVTLNQSNFTSPGIALALTSDTTSLGLRGTTMVSTGGQNAMLCKNISLYETANDVVGKLVVPQKLLVCGTVSGGSLLDCSQITGIDQVTFEKMLNPCKITFDANGGICDESSRNVYNGAAIGDLPIPTRDYYSFDGWYMNGSSDPVTAETVLPVSDNQVLIAHWTENAASDWVKASELPEGAQVLDTKWTYNLSVYKQVVDSYTYYKYCSYYDNIWNQDSCWVNNTSSYHEITVASPIPANPNKFADKGGRAAGLCGPKYACGHKVEGQSYWWLKSTNYKTVLDRVESKESATEPSGNNISNIVKWVKYRPKSSALAVASI